MDNAQREYLTIGDDNGAKYDAEVRDMLERTNAQAVMIVVVGGKRGTGMRLKLHQPDSVIVRPQLATQLMHIMALLNPEDINS